MSAIRGLSNLTRKLATVKERVELAAATKIQDAAGWVLTKAAMSVPQWSGDTAASWQIVLDGEPTDSSRSVLYREYSPEVENRDNAYFRGNSIAVNEAELKSKSAIARIKWNSEVRLVNGSVDAPMLNETPNNQFRANNYIPNDIMAMAYLSHRYSFLRPST